MDFILTEPTPLKHSILDIDIGKTPIVRSATSTQVVCLSHVKSAVEWLKEQFTKYRVVVVSDYQLGIRYKDFITIINNTFPDLYPSGDLIAPLADVIVCQDCKEPLVTLDDDMILIKSQSEMK